MVKEIGRFSTLYKWILFNIGMIFALVFTFIFGILDPMFNSDAMYIIFIMLLVFGFGLISSGYHSYSLGKEFLYLKNKDERGKYSDFLKRIEKFKETNKQTTLSIALQLRIFSEISHIKFIATTMTILGFLGTAIGVAAVILNIPDIASIDQLSNIISVITHGMGIALYTTIAGIVLNLWLGVNYQFLVAGVSKLVSRILEAE